MINQPNATLEFKYGEAQHKFFLQSGPLDLIPNCIIDAICNENGIVTNYIFQPIL